METPSKFSPEKSNVEVALTWAKDAIKNSPRLYLEALAEHPCGTVAGTLAAVTLGFWITGHPNEAAIAGYTTQAVFLGGILAEVGRSTYIIGKTALHNYRNGLSGDELLLKDIIPERRIF